MGETALDLTGIEFVNEGEEEYFIRARLGDEVRDFLLSPTGRYLHQRVKIDYEDAKEQLANQDLTTGEGVAAARQLQQKAQIAAAFMTYLAGAITDGDAAHKELEEARNPGD